MVLLFQQGRFHLRSLRVDVFVAEMAGLLRMLVGFVGRSDKGGIPLFFRRDKSLALGPLAQVEPLHGLAQDVGLPAHLMAGCI